MCSPEYPDVYDNKYTTLCGCHVRVCDFYYAISLIYLQFQKCATYVTIFMIFVQLFFLPCEKEYVMEDLFLTC